MTFAWNLYFEAGNMRCSNMNYALLILSPPNLWSSTHFAKDYIDVFNFVNALSFKNTISNTAPSIIQRKFYLNAKFTHCNIWKCLRVRIKVDFKVWIVASYIRQYFSNSILELGGCLKPC